MTVAAAKADDFTDVVRSALDLFARLRRALGVTGHAELAQALADAKQDALQVARELRERSSVSAHALAANRAIRLAIDNLIEGGIRTPQAIEVYTLAARQGREQLARFDSAAMIAGIIADLVALSREANVAHEDLAAAYDDLRQQVAREAQERPNVVEFVEDLEDVIAAIEAEREQGDEPPVPQDELVDRLGFGRTG